MAEHEPGIGSEGELPVGLASTAGSLRSAQRMAGLGTLIAGVAHELNNPITYVLGNLGELQRLLAHAHEALALHRGELERALGVQAPEAIARAQEKLERAGGMALLDDLVAETLEGAVRIRDTVRELLGYARPDGVGGVPVQIHEVLDFNLRMLKSELVRRVTVVRDYAATKTIEGNRASIGQLLLNLIRNASQACSSGDPARDRIAVRTRDCPGGIAIEIEDTGPGIPAAHRAQLFQPFFTTRPAGEGTGLGLYMSRWIAEDHGGSLEFECGETSGTTFRVFLAERQPLRPARTDPPQG